MRVMNIQRACQERKNHTYAFGVGPGAGGSAVVVAVG